MKGTASATTLDTCLWLALPLLALWLLPNGYVSGDGLGQSLAYAAGAWHLNPNHLLFEPLGAWWQHAFAHPGGLPVDALKGASALCGAFAAALFRGCVAARLAVSRSAANVGTACLAGGSAFLRLWVSDEIHLLQMPALVLVAAAAIAAFERTTPARCALLGAATGLAALAFVANALFAVAFAGALLLRGNVVVAVRGSCALAGGAAIAALPAFAVAWHVADVSVGLVEWLTRYSGGQTLPRTEAVYGAAPTLAGVAEAGVRAGYGAASALVDLSPLATAFRDRVMPGPGAGIAVLAWLAAAFVLWRGACALRRASCRGLAWMCSAWAAAVLAFGVFWNDSDEQFYVQLAPLSGVLACLAFSTARRRTLSIACTFALTCNAYAVGAERLTYPRGERLALIERTTRDACLVVVPGFDEAHRLLLMSNAPQAGWIALTELAVRQPPADGLRMLRDRIDACRAAGGRIVLIDLCDLPPRRPPWQFLQRLGYGRDEVHAALHGMLMQSSDAAPFAVRTVRPL